MNEETNGAGTGRLRKRQNELRLERQPEWERCCQRMADYSTRNSEEGEMDVHREVIPRELLAQQPVRCVWCSLLLFLLVVRTVQNIPQRIPNHSYYICFLRMFVCAHIYVCIPVLFPEMFKLQKWCSKTLSRHTHMHAHTLSYFSIFLKTR